MAVTDGYVEPFDVSSEVRSTAPITEGFRYLAGNPP